MEYVSEIISAILGFVCGSGITFYFTKNDNSKKFEQNNSYFSQGNQIGEIHIGK